MLTRPPSWAHGRRRQLGPALRSLRLAFMLLKFLTFEQEILHFHFVLDPAHYVAGPGDGLFFPLGMGDSERWRYVSQ